MCWGNNIYGQLGDGSTTNRLSPVTVTGVAGGVIQAGNDHTCLLNSGSIKCWGRNYEGQLGNGTFLNSSSAVDVTGISGATDLAAGALHTCVVLPDQNVACWGSNSEGQLGKPSYFPLPVPVIGIAGSVPAPEEPLVPARLLDTRAGGQTIDGRFAGTGRRGAGSTLELPIGGRGGVPTGAAAVVVNVTAVDALGAGFVTVYPCDAQMPLASSLNYMSGATIPNELVSKLSSTGTICLYTLAATDLIVDVTGWLPTTPGYTPLVPARLLDTRPGNPTIDGQYAGQGQRQLGTTLELQVSGRGGVPADAAAVVVNVTAVAATASGYVTVYPCDAPMPLASSLNYTSGATIPNELISKLSSTGTICLYTLAATDLIVDVTGTMT